VKGAALEEKLDRLVVQEAAVLDRVDAGSQRGIDARRAMRVRGNSASTACIGAAFC
jgi:hypothetical protein